MAAIRKKPINPFLYKVLEAYGYQEHDGRINIKAAAIELGIPYGGLIGAANIDGSHLVLEFHLQAAQALNVPFELWCKGLLGKLNKSEEAELSRLLRAKKAVKLVS